MLKARRRRGEKEVERLAARRLEERRLPVSEDLQAASPSASRFLLFTSRNEVRQDEDYISGGEVAASR